MHLGFVKNANKHLTTIQVAQSIKAKGQNPSKLRFEEI